MADWEAEGLLEGLEGADRDARIRLLDKLEAEGCEIGDIRRSHRDGELLFMLAGRAIGVQPTMTAPELVEASGVGLELAARMARAQGLALADDDEVAYGEPELAMLRTLAEFMKAGVSEDDIVAVGRLLGRGFSQAAEAMRGTAMRMVLEPGLEEAELAERYALVAGALTPMMEPLLANLLRLHLSKMFQTEILNEEERRAGALPGARRVTAGFADLVGFTKLGEQVPPDELGAVADRLEVLLLDVLEPSVRFVKTIGDAVMVVSPDPVPMIDTALALIERADAEGESFPQLRVGLAAGEALSRGGDWFGRPVNLASRLTGIARPASVLTDDAVHEAAPDRYRWSKAGIRHLKNVGDAVAAWRVRPLESGETGEGA